MDFAEFMEQQEERAASWQACAFLIQLVERSGLHEREQDSLISELTDGVDWERYYEIKNKVDDALPPAWSNWKGDMTTVHKLLDTIL